jgi:hypothetical protein
MHTAAAALTYSGGQIIMDFALKTCFLLDLSRGSSSAKKFIQCRDILTFEILPKQCTKKLTTARYILVLIPPDQPRVNAKSIII